jgi:hypothetical protein
MNQQAKFDAMIDERMFGLWPANATGCKCGVCAQAELK